MELCVLTAAGGLVVVVVLLVGLMIWYSEKIDGLQAAPG